MLRRAPLLLPLLALAGCLPHGFDRTNLYARLQEGKIEVNECDVASAMELKPQLTFPCRIAVYLSPRNYSHWTGKEKEMIDSWGEKLKREGIASEVFLMSEMFTTGTSLKDLRVAAAKYGANALLVIQGGCDVESSLNPAAVFNLTIVGGFVVPGSRRDALFLLQGGLVDVGNEFLYASIEAEGEARTIRPSFLAEDKPAVDRAKQKAFENFGPELLKRLRAVRSSAAAPQSLSAAESKQPQITTAPTREGLAVTPK
jgi:hypothetical protein